jgi:hypothetical protein
MFLWSKDWFQIHVSISLNRNNCSQITIFFVLWTESKTGNEQFNKYNDI